MKKLLILITILLIGCGYPKYLSPNTEYTTTNIDSICQVDTLPVDSEDWIQHSLRDYESGKAFIQYLYVKDSIIYIRTDSTIIKRQ